MDFKNILIERKDKLEVITINRPNVLNALNDETISELHQALREIFKDEQVRVVIFTGAGEKAFVAGADIGELKVCDALSGHRKSINGQRLLYHVENMEQVAIAAINGFALGGGCELALACDIRIASENAKLGQPEVNLGIIPGYGGTQRMARLVGKGKAKELIFTGDMIDAAEALRIGLIEKVVPQTELMKIAEEMAAKIISKGPLAIKAAKRAINLGLDVDLKSGLEYEAMEFSAICASEDKTEGTAAFLEKRKPNFKGK
jgi:enoyl-CoA hydratase